MLRRLVSIPLVLLLVAIIHLDWHLARPHHHHRLSFDWDYHWLVAIPVFALAAAYVHRRFPGREWAAGAANLFLAALGAQVLEPLAEELYYLHRFVVMTDALRWAVFAEFMVAGIAAFAATMLVLKSRARRATSPAGAGS
ncbi:MAG TPA: hypothetical protein VEW03_12855 [Longimicrobiaceae bacterium]|nr:hypothetical protein [Longimicrobiaceae bacterium]